MRPLGLDTILRSELEPQPDGSFLHQGRRVVCLIESFCTAYGSRAEERTWAATQDVGLTAWGLWMQGLSFTTIARGRARAGGDLVWPRSDDRFDVLLAYAQLVRGPLRFKLGRQETRTGLGFAAFDGGSVSYTRRNLTLDVYGGRSLARGLREPANEALRGLESFFVDQSAYLGAASASVRIGGSAFAARYQREILADRSGLVSERGSFDFTGPLPRGRIEGSMDYDFAVGRAGKGHLTVSVPFAEAHGLVEVSARRYVPYFDLSTIWGFFQPVSYSEAEMRAAWSPSAPWGGWISGSYRAYAPTGTTVVLEPLRDDGWRANLGARWSPRVTWTAEGTYRLEWGPGGFLSSLDASVRHAPSERLSVAATATTLQQIEEFRLGDGRAFGGGVSVDFGIGQRTSLSGGASFLRHGDGGTATSSPWSQTRVWTSLRIELGEDPGLAARGRR